MAAQSGEGEGRGSSEPSSHLALWRRRRPPPSCTATPLQRELDSCTVSAARMGAVPPAVLSARRAAVALGDGDTEGVAAPLRLALRVPLALMD